MVRKECGAKKKKEKKKKKKRKKKEKKKKRKKRGGKYKLSGDLLLRLGEHLINKGTPVQHERRRRVSGTSVSISLTIEERIAVLRFAIVLLVNFTSDFQKRASVLGEGVHDGTVGEDLRGRKGG